jgi:RNA polymerase sigma-70 factor, ECF subfamily
MKEPLTAVNASQEKPVLPSSLARLYFDQHDRLFRAAYRIAGNATDAEDVVQTVFLRFAGREGNSNDVDNLAAYLYRAAINTALDLLRARREGQLVSLEVVEDRRDDNSVSEDDHALRTRLREALSRLRPRWAEMFVLKHIEGCDNGEIARLCGTSQAVVAVTLFRARSRLKTDLTAQIGGAP